MSTGHGTPGRQECKLQALRVNRNSVAIPDSMEKKIDIYIYLQTKSIIYRPVIGGRKDTL